ncbi:hypothetical protein JXA47_04985 [Candidatus Sumerlaeota bacterium]|nr:hypothetical protein [Candidatus Sumerlaeota bacterium]
MRIFRYSTPALLVAGLSVGLAMSAVAQDEGSRGDRLSSFDAPQAVIDAIREIAGDNEITSVGREREDGATLYEAEYFEGDLKRSIKVTEEGALVELEIGVAAEDLPQAVRDAVLARMPSAEITGGEFVHTTHHTVQLTVDGHGREIVVSPWGGGGGSEEERQGDDEEEGPDEEEGEEMSDEAEIEHDQFSLVFSNPTEITNPYLPLDHRRIFKRH